MAWTNIDNALVSVGALPFATTVQALRDNPIAIANGDAGAPKVQTAALSRGAYVRQGQGSGMLGNEVYIGWNASALIAQVDAVPLGVVHTSGLGTGAVGTYAFGSISVPGFTVREPGYTTSIGYAAVPAGTTSSAPGTWRLMGRMSNPSGDPAVFGSVFLRIA